MKIEKSGFLINFWTVIFCFFFVFFINTAGVSAQTDDNIETSENLTFNFNLSALISGSGAYYFQQSEFNYGFETWLHMNIYGNLGNSVSYFTGIGVGLVNVERQLLEKNVEMKDRLAIGETWTLVDIYNYPLGYFPYSYRSSWDGFIFPLNALNAGGPSGWPDTTSIGISTSFGISGSVFNDVFKWNIGRHEREAAAVVEGYSLVLNKFAQPFLGYDLTLNLFSWLSVYHVTGSLEYFSSKGIKESSKTFQNAFSLTMMSVNIFDYVKLEAGSSVIWPKRFELGYLFPGFHLLIQNSYGDFDNLAMFGNIKLQYPGLGLLWFSLFIDEINFEENFFSLAREMYAYQAGLQYQASFLPSGLFTLSYTKIEPYNYTHQKTDVPWYNQPMEQAYTNHGYGLGYYLPPNSDELKLVFSFNALEQTRLNFQFQMIRHGAEYGDNKVFGSSYMSELQENDRSNIFKNFLNDGAYQWLFIIKAGGDHTFNEIPLIINFPIFNKLQMSLIFNAGVVISYWTCNGSVLDNAQYPSRTGVIMDIGFKMTF